MMLQPEPRTVDHYTHRLEFKAFVVSRGEIAGMHSSETLARSSPRLDNPCSGTKLWLYVAKPGAWRSRESRSKTKTALAGGFGFVGWTPQFSGRRWP